MTLLLTTDVQADVSVLRMVKCDVLLEDCQAEMRRIRNRLVPVAVWRNGERMDVEVACDEHGQWPNKDPEYLAARTKDRRLLGEAL